MAIHYYTNIFDYKALQIYTLIGIFGVKIPIPSGNLGEEELSETAREVLPSSDFS
jgi:hypothetical protein